MASLTMKRRPGTDVAIGNSANDKLMRLSSLGAQLKNARTSFEPHWRELAEFFRPRRIRFQTSDRNRGDKRNQKILDSTPIFAARTLSSGMMSGITSPARQWFKLAIADQKLLKHDGVKQWLDDVRELMVAVLNRSNFYEVLSTYYSDLGVFATSAMIVEEDDAKVIRCTHFALGEYWIGYNAKQQVRVFMREFELTVRQVVEQFGTLNGDTYETKNFSETLQAKWAANQTEQPITVTHVIYENPDYDTGRIESKHQRYASCYYESTGPRDRFLDEGGYAEWPIMAVRWEVTTGDVYGTDCPGMTALGDAKELMFAKKLAAGALNKAVNPPMTGPVTLRQVPVSILPGGITYFDEMGDKKIRPLLDTSQFRLDWAIQHIEKLSEMIERAFFVDMFLLIANIEKANTTATEILEKKEEKLLTLGPVGKQIDGGFLDPFFDRLYGIMLRRGLIPDPPPELNGVPFHPEYESIMAQAQRAQGRTGIEAFSIFVLNAAKADPSIFDRVDVDEMVQRYSEVTGNPANFIRGDEAVAAIRKARAQAQAQAQAAANAESVANSANKLAGASTSGKNALTDLLAATPPDNTLGSPSPVGGL